MDRYIFLDFDGVINTQRHKWALAGERLPVKDDYGPFFDPEAVENLRDIVTSTDAGIIITSSWKVYGLEAMQTLWNVRRMPGMLLDITPSLPAAFLYTRGMEINKWLYAHTSGNPEECRYVIIDDEDVFLPEQSPYVVTTDPIVGLTAEDAEKAKTLLL